MELNKIMSEQLKTIDTWMDNIILFGIVTISANVFFAISFITKTLLPIILGFIFVIVQIYILFLFFINYKGVDK